MLYIILFPVTYITFGALSLAINPLLCIILAISRICYPYKSKPVELTTYCAVKLVKERTINNKIKNTIIDFCYEKYNLDIHTSTLICRYLLKENVPPFKKLHNTNDIQA